MAFLFEQFIFPITTGTKMLTGGTIDFYHPLTTGESNRKDVYTNRAGTIVAQNPYTLDGVNANATLYGNGGYHVVIKDENGVTVYDYETAVGVGGSHGDASTGMVSALSYGVVGDGATDTTTEILAALEDAATNGFALFFPAGVYICSEQILIAATTNFAMYGEGMDVTLFYFTDPTSCGFDITVPYSLGTPDSSGMSSFHDFSVMKACSSGGSTGTAFKVFTGEYDGVGGGSAVELRLYNINCRVANTYALANSWFNGVHIGRPTSISTTGGGALCSLDNIHVVGRVQNPDATGSGIIFDTATGSKINGCHILWFDKAIEVTGHTEGPTIIGVNAVACNYGLVTTTESQQPGLVLIGSHLNSFKGGVHITKRNGFFISNNLFYQRPESTHTPYHDVWLRDTCNFGSITNNSFLASSEATTPTNRTTAIRMDDVSGVTCFGNIIRNRDFGVVIDSPPFLANTEYLLGDTVVATSDDGFVYEVTIAGTTSTEPTWPANEGDTVVSGTVTFTCRDWTVLNLVNYGNDAPLTYGLVNNLPRPYTANYIASRRAMDSSHFIAGAVAEMTIPNNKLITVGGNLFASNTAYSLDDQVVSLGDWFICTTAGTSDASEPTWDRVVGNTTTSGTAVFTCKGDALFGSGDVYSAGGAQLASQGQGKLTVLQDTQKVVVKANVSFSANATGYRRARIIKNGAHINGLPDVTVQPVTGVSTEIHLHSAPIEVVAGDYFQIQVYQTSGSDQTLLNTTKNWFSMEIVA